MTTAPKTVFLCLVTAIIAGFLFSSCSPALVVRVQAPKTAGSTAAPSTTAATANFSAALTPTAEGILRRITDQKDETPLFDAASLKTGFASAGMTVDSARFPAPGALELGISAPSTAAIPGKAILVNTSAKTIDISLSRASIGEILALLPPETTDYLDLLMAPVFTGEELTESEYREIIAAAYGKTLAGELEKSILTLTVYAPGTVKTASADLPATAQVKNGAAQFSVPLSVVLVLENTLTLRTTW
jgi:hypothetical protein